MLRWIIQIERLDDREIFNEFLVRPKWYVHNEPCFVPNVANGRFQRCRQPHWQFAMEIVVVAARFNCHLACTNDKLLAKHKKDITSRVVLLTSWIADQILSFFQIGFIARCVISIFARSFNPRAARFAADFNKDSFNSDHLWANWERKLTVL